MFPEWSNRIKAMAKQRGVEVDELIKILVAQGVLTLEGGIPTEEDIKKAVSLGLDHSFWLEYEQLKAKRQREDLAPDEQDRLINLSDKVEVANTHRMAYLSLLAELQNIPLETLVDKYTRGARPYA